MPFYCSFFFVLSLALSLVLMLISPTLVHAEYWLSDRLFIENHQQLLISNNNNNNNTNLHGQLLPELTMTQGLNNSALVFGTKLNLQRHQADATINNANLRFSPQLLNSFLPESLTSRMLITLGRQKISYAQADLFTRSLTKNDDQTDALNYSQGLKIRHRLGFIEQSIFFNQYARSDSLSAPAKHHGTSTHYQLKVGVPGYIVGPAMLVIESPSQRDDPLRVMLGSAVQLPLRIVPGDWQWAFQYASELSDNKPSHKKQKAWQTSISWLGFIPQHKVGILFSHSDDDWIYSDDFKSAQDRIEIRYQWTFNQRASVEWALSESNIDINSKTKTEKALHGRFTFSI
jgi:hypothetical protein